MSRLSRIFGRRRGASREAEVVTALRELEQTLQQVEARLRSEPLARRPAPERPRPDPPPPPPLPEPEPPERAEPLFARSVELDVGPFADFGALSAFERELARLPDITGVYVRRFLDDRAVVELTATREIPLVRLLGDELSQRFEIEHVEREYLKITLSAE